LNYELGKEVTPSPLAGEGWGEGEIQPEITCYQVDNDELAQIVQHNYYSRSGGAP